MSISALDEQAALIVIDLQVGTVANPTAHPAGEVVARARELLAAFRRRRLLVVLANVDGTPAGRTEYSEGARDFPPEWKQLLPELDQQPDDVTLTRRTWSAFAGTGLAVLLTEGGVTQVVLAGMATSFGVESTARDAYDLGFNVVLALDAITDPNPHAHDNSATRVFPALGQTGPVSEIITLLGER
ncbi:cysteine hydrolase [Arthrobacter sp. 24S4-2]|uniref:isochorismatase family cysteine hydrolase n=1 Tax=Arthrobacter sp. 24S4-2 TaxID=2575374 RepID=UPI0010C7B069|nr:isochorismatase family cysteine hydrolase [Arthrobacter sp. 24S4-2]QCO96746.1 cysteine hydrolase [Arthrobacter sp. 24S4-2]